MTATPLPLRLARDKVVPSLLLAIFALAPFQKRLHGFFDSLSRRIKLPELALPDHFSTKLHLFISDFLIIGCVAALFLYYRPSLRTFFWDGPAKYLTLLFLVFLTSTTFSITATYSLQYFKLFQFSLIFLFFNSICCLRQRVDFTQFVKRVAWMLVGIALCQCLISLCQYFFQDSVGLGFLGERNIKKFRFPSSGKPLWIFSELLGSQNDSPFLYRVAGTFYHPNIFGGFLLSSLLASCYLVIQEARRWIKTSLLFAILLQVFTLYLTFSRSAALALIISLAAWGILQIRNILMRDGVRSQAFRRFAVLAVTLVFSGCLGLALLYSQLSARGGMVNYNSVTKGADTERVVYMKTATEMVKEHPFLGVGYNNFQIHASMQQEKYPHNFLHSKVHNIYLLVTSEAGLIGGGIFLLFLFSILRSAWRGIQSSSHFQAAAFLASVFLGYLVIGGCDFYFLESPQGSIPFFGVAALLYSINPLDT